MIDLPKNSFNDFVVEKFKEDIGKVYCRVHCPPTPRLFHFLPPKKQNPQNGIRTKWKNISTEEFTA